MFVKCGSAQQAIWFWKQVANSMYLIGCATALFAKRAVMGRTARHLELHSRANALSSMPEIVYKLCKRIMAFFARPIVK